MESPRARHTLKKKKHIVIYTIELLIVVHSLIATVVEILLLIARSWRCPVSRGMSKQTVGFCPSLLLSLWSNTDGNQPHGGKLKQKPWKNTDDLLVSSGSLSCLSQITQDQLPRESTTHSRLNPSASISSQLSHRHAHRPIQWRRFFNCDSLFPDVSCFCQVDKS